MYQDLSFVTEVVSLWSLLKGTAVDITSTVLLKAGPLGGLCCIVMHKYMYVTLLTSLLSTILTWWRVYVYMYVHVSICTFCKLQVHVSTCTLYCVQV